MSRRKGTQLMRVDNSFAKELEKIKRSSPRQTTKVDLTKQLANELKTRFKRL